MRILFLTPRSLWPLVSGGRTRDYHLARTLGERCDLTLLGYHEHDTGTTLKKQLKFCERVHTYALPARYTAWKVLWGLLSSTPLSILNYRSGPLRTGFTELLTGYRYDLVHIAAIHLAEYHETIRQLAPTRPWCSIGITSNPSY